MVVTKETKLAYMVYWTGGIVLSLMAMVVYLFMPNFATGQVAVIMDAMVYGINSIIILACSICIATISKRKETKNTPEQLLKAYSLTGHIVSLVVEVVFLIILVAVGKYFMTKATIKNISTINTAMPIAMFAFCPFLFSQILTKAMNIYIFKKASDKILLDMIEKERAKKEMEAKIKAEEERIAKEKAEKEFNDLVEKKAQEALKAQENSNQ